MKRFCNSLIASPPPSARGTRGLSNNTHLSFGFIFIMFISFFNPFQLFNQNQLQAQTFCDTQDTTVTNGNKTTGPPCGLSINYAPDSAHLDYTPVITIYLNFHFILRDDGTGNYRATDNGDPDTPDTFNNGYYIAQSIVQQANEKLNKLRKMRLPPGNSTQVIPEARYRYEIYTDPDDSTDQGIYFWDSTEIYYYDHKYALGSKTVQFEYTFPVPHQNVINVFVFGEKKNQAQDSNGGVASGYEDNHHTLLMTSAWFREIELNMGSSWYLYANILNHEIGHLLGLYHTWGKNDYCDDTPKNCNCWNIDSSEIPDSNTWCTAPNCGDSNVVSNNLMDYNIFRNAITPCQLGKIHYYLNNTLPNFVKPDYCTVDTTKNIHIQSGEQAVWNSTRYLRSNLIIEPGAKLTLKCTLHIPKDGEILVKRGAKLIVDGGTLTNACGQMWQGIRVEGDPNNPHPSTVDVLNNTATPTSGVAILNNATIENAYIGVWNTDKSWPQNHYGGIIIADSTTFRNCRTGIGFMKYKYDNASRIRFCHFITDDSLPGGQLPYAGITLWQVKGVDIIDCRFENKAPGLFDAGELGSGIVSIDAGYKVDGNLIAYDPQSGNPVYHYGTFKNLTRGIDAENISNPLAQILVYHQQFDTVQEGVLLRNSFFDEIRENTFTIPAWPLLPNTLKGQYAIKLNGSQGYYVADNTINTTNDAVNNHGIVVRNTYGGQLHYNTVNSNYTAIQTEQYNEILKMSCNTLTGNHLGLSINPNSPYGSLQDQGEGCDQQDYRPANAFVNFDCANGALEIRSSIDIVYYDNEANPNHLDTTCIDVTANSIITICSPGQTLGQDVCSYESITDTVPTHDDASNLRTSINNSSDPVEKQLLRNDLMRVYIALDTTQSVMLSLLDEMNNHPADKLSIQAYYADSNLTEARNRLDTLTLRNLSDSLFYQTMDILLTAAAI